ncbi:MAG TPA: histidine--tRNA ligase, partial [Bacteroidia bacterium]|nr:histidine--tRNA ligase [Bacteroidia bacterium]
FKRYQIQPVWRADRPQKGRYREFYQCDADVIGSDSLLNEVEMIQMIDEVFSKLGISVKIKINNRKILNALAKQVGITNKEDFDLFISIIDKIDKEGRVHVLNMLAYQFKLEGKEWHNFFTFLFESSSASTNANKIGKLKDLFGNSETEKIGYEEIDYIFKNFIKYPDPMSLKNELELDLSLARGLNYYTGTIFEVKVNDSRSTFTSSILGGGRYDDLTGIFGLPNVSGVGISFGVDRIYDVMEEMKLFGQLNLQSSTTQVMFVNFGKEEEKYCLKLLQQVRTAGINAEIYPDSAKMKKQMSYADDKKIPFVVLVGSEEIKTGELTLKNMQTGEQEKLKIEDVILKINNSH